MGNCILVLLGESQYDVLKQAAKEIAKGFRKYSDLPVIEVDLTVSSNIEILEESLNSGKMKPELIFAMQAVLFEAKITDDKLLFSTVDIPVFGSIYDHPYYHEFRIISMNNTNMLLSYINQTDGKYLERYYHINPKFHYFLAHGGFLGNGMIPFEQRIPAVFFSGGYQSEEKAWQGIEELPEVFAIVAKSWIKKFENNSLEQKQEDLCLRQVLMDMNFECSLEEEKEIFDYIYPVVDDIIRTKGRNQAIRSLVEAGIPVAVVGKGWNQFTCHNRELLQILSDTGGLPISEVVRLMGNFQMVLNISTTFAQGSHERIPTAMLNGSICITNPSTYLYSRFQHQKEILYYDPENINTLSEVVQWVWQHPKEAKQLAENAYNIAIENDTWQHRSKEILEYIKKWKER